MTLRGKVQGGVVVLDGGEHLPDGLEVEVLTLEDANTTSSDTESTGGRTLNERYAAFIGKATGLPPDLALNHDHYLYGCPKR